MLGLLKNITVIIRIPITLSPQSWKWKTWKLPQMKTNYYWYYWREPIFTSSQVWHLPGLVRRSGGFGLVYYFDHGLANQPVFLCFSTNQPTNSQVLPPPRLVELPHRNPRWSAAAWVSRNAKTPRCPGEAGRFGRFLIIISIWVFPKIGVPRNGWFIRENPIKMDDLGVQLFSETPICPTFPYWLL